MSDTRNGSSSARIAPGAWPRWRVILIRLWAGLLTAQALVMAQGIAVIGSAGPHERFMYATSTVWKLVSLGAVAVILWTGGRTVLGYWIVGVGQLVWTIAGILAPQPDANGPLLQLVNVALFYGPLVALRPHRRELLHPKIAVNRVLLMIAVVGSFPMAIFAPRLAGRLHGELGFDMVGLYLVLCAMGLFAALEPCRSRWLAQAVAAGAVLTGGASIAYPHDLASSGLIGGVLLIIGGAAFAAAACRPQPQQATRTGSGPAPDVSRRGPTTPAGRPPETTPPAADPPPRTVATKAPA
jgi:hypothetical protein